MPGIDVDKLRLTDFLDLPTLQEIQDNFAAVANVKATITDAQGNLITQPTPTKEFLHRQSAIADAEEKQEGPQREGREYVAPIMVGQQRLGTDPHEPRRKTGGLDEAKLSQLAKKICDRPGPAQIAHHADESREKHAAGGNPVLVSPCQCDRPPLLSGVPAPPSAINELTAVYNVTTMLADARDLQCGAARAR